MFTTSYSSDVVVDTLHKPVVVGVGATTGHHHHHHHHHHQHRHRLQKQHQIQTQQQRPKTNDAASTNQTSSRTSSAKYSYKLYVTGSEKESAAAWLAAAMSAMTASSSVVSASSSSHLHHQLSMGAVTAHSSQVQPSLTSESLLNCFDSSLFAPVFAKVQSSSASQQTPTPTPPATVSSAILTQKTKESTPDVLESNVPTSTNALTPTTVTTPKPIPTRRLSRPLTPPKVEQLNVVELNNNDPKLASAESATLKPSVVVGTTVSKLIKPLLPFGVREDKVRRTSILRPPPHLIAQESYTKKNVRFADALGLNLENVRLFSSTPAVSRRYSSYNAPTSQYNVTEFDSPWNMALNLNARQFYPSETCLTSNGTSSSQKRFDLKPANFTSPSLQLNFDTELDRQGVMLHSLTCAETTVYGTVSVMNRHFDKKVVVRYTFNDWSSYIERDTVYMLGSHDGRTDKFSFAIYARPEDFHQQQSPTLPTSSAPLPARLQFAIRFTTGDGLECWDNNHDRNYTLNLAPH